MSTSWLNYHHRDTSDRRQGGHETRQRANAALGQQTISPISIRSRSSLVVRSIVRVERSAHEVGQHVLAYADASSARRE